MIKVYGIKNCNTVKKTLDYLDDNQLSYEFIDFKKQIPSKAELTRWKKAFGDWPVNTKGPTYRKIKAEFGPANAAKKYEILMKETSAIKRPILEKSGSVHHFGHDLDQLAKLS